MLRRSWSLVATAIVVCGVACACAPADAEEFSAEQLEFFETKVRPLLAENCYACHSGKAGVAKGGVRLDHRQTLLEGGDSGPAVAPGDPDASLLLEAVRYESFQMPPSGKLPEQDIQTLARWVEMGAPWPDEPLPEVNGGEEVFDLQARRDEHWAWRPIASPTPPAVADASWPADPLDQFILARLEAESLRPAPPKSRTALLRRLSFDLTGLPPTPEEVREFSADESPEATAKLVDRLLASPRFGERWGRHWLDLVRYAESRGHEYDYDAPNAYQYRDYAIRAFNQDVPYDQFLREHLAGDLMESPRLNPEKGFNESILGTGFWHLGEWVHSPVDTRKDEADRFDNMLDVMSKSMLAMTVSCARCHDHKFDAISSVDYHALSGFLQSSDFRQTRFESMTHNQAVARRLAELDARYQAQVRRLLAAADAELPTVISGGERAAGPTTPPCPVSARVLIDFATLPPAEFRQDGFAFGDSVRRAGEPCLAYTGGKPTLGLASHTGAAFDPFWRDLENVSQAFVNTPGQLDPAVRGGRTLRTPTVQLATGDVHLLVRGGGQAYACVDTHRTLAGPLHLDVLVRSPASDLPDQPRWVAMKLQRYAGARVHFEFTPDEHNQLEVLRVVERAAVDAPAPSEFAESREPPTLAGNEAEALRRWRDGETLPEPVATALASRLRRVLESPSEYLSLDKARELEAVAAEWAEQRERLRGEVMRRSALAMASMDLSGEDDHRLIRGNTATPAEVVPRRFLEAIDGPEPMEIPRGSGRMQLAERVVDPANPLTSRVIVNRVWHHLLGVGIVPTPDNFGVLGKEPTHPELLDYLATEFVRDGQSIKRLIRRVALSSTYAMSSAADPDAIAADPQNLLWSHVPPKRLEAEPIRDTLLLLSGRLDERMYGQSTPLHLTSFMQGRGRPKQSGPLDGDGRRSIYLEVRRNFLSPMALAFDLPSPFSCMGRRTRSNVPAQALVLLNSPFVAEQTRLWAGRALASPAASAEDRVDYLYRSGLGRDPTQEERAAVVQFVRSESAAQGVPPDAPSLWADAAHALVNAKEFIYLP